MLSNWIHNLFNNDTEERNNVNILNKQVKELYKPCVLTQGQRLHNNQVEKINALTPNLLAFNEPITTPYVNTSPFVNTNTYAQYVNTDTYANGSRYSNANTYATTNTYTKGNFIEGFGPIETTAKNNAEWQDTTNVSTDYAQKVDNYASEYPSLLAHSRMYSQGTDRNINYKQNTLSLNQDINMKYNITANKEGCYKQVPGSDLVYQSDMNDVTLDTCKKRTSDLAYAGFSIKTKADGKLGCYLLNDVAGNKTAGIATKPQTSLAFKTNKSANMGGLLKNGQLGIFQDTKTLATDLTAVPSCNVDGSKILINPDTVTATWGGNCVNNIKSEFNGKCIDQHGGSKDPYLQMQMWDCEQGNPNQNMVYNNDSKTINPPGNNLCMDVLGAGTADGTKVIQYSCNGGANQKWTYGMDKTLQPQNAPGKCLDLLNSNNENGAGLGIWDCNGGANQKWDITRNGAVFTPIPPRLKINTSNAWQLIGTDRHTGASPDASFWKVRSNQSGTDTYYPVGHAVYAGSSSVYKKPPSMSTVMVSGDVTDPVGYNSIGRSGGVYNINIKQPICPQGYTSLGDVVTSNNSDSSAPQDIKCVPTDCVDANPQPGNTVWSGLGTKITVLNSNTTAPVSASNGYNLFKSSDSGPFYSIKQQCLS